MSSVHNRIVTTFAANAGNTIAVMNQVAGGMTNIGRASMHAQRQSSLWNQQMRAIGTTMRYALAGTAVFGMTRMINTLRETQRQFALIGVLGNFDEMMGSTREADKALSDLYTNAQRGSMEALVPVNDFNNALVNLYSTVQGVQPDAAVQMVTEIAKGAQLAQVPVEDLTRAVTGMAQAFEGGGRRTPAQLAPYIRGFQALTAQAPGGIAFGPQFIQQLPNLAATARFAAFTPEQMMGLYLTSLRTGATPATAGRGLQYLMQSIGVPQSKEAARALRKAGVTPESVQREGGMATLNKIMAFARSQGITPRAEKTLGGLTEEQADILETTSPEQAARTLGISGKGLEWMSQAIGRIHGIRTLVTLAAQTQDPKNNQMVKDLETISRAMDDTQYAQSEFARAWDRFAKDQPLQAAAVSVDVIRRQMVEAFETPINALSRGLTKFGSLAISDPEKTQTAVQVGGGLLAAYGLSRFFLRGRGKGMRLPGVGGLVGGALAAQGAIAGGAPTGSMQNPFYVVVLYQLGGGGTSVVPAPGPGGRARGRFGRLRRVARGARGIIGGAATWTAARAGGFTRMGRFARFGPFAGIGAGAAALAFPEDIATENPLVMRARDLERQGRLPAFQNIAGARRRQVEGRAVMTLNLNLRKPDGSIERRRIHVPMELWNKGPVRSNRGKAGG
jgi:hypothetical protein